MAWPRCCGSGCVECACFGGCALGRAAPSASGPALADSFVMGGAGTSAVSVALRVRSGVMFGANGGFDLYPRWGSILMRSWLASRELLHSSGKIVLSSDASRFQQDTLLGVAGTHTEKNKFIVTVIPPNSEFLCL